MGQHLPFNAKVPAIPSASAPVSCPVLTANHLLWPRVLCMSCCCHVYVCPFLLCLLYLPLVPQFMLKWSNFCSREFQGMEGYALANEKKTLEDQWISVSIKRI